MRVLEETSDRLVVESPPVRWLLALAVVFSLLAIAMLNAAVSSSTFSCDRASGQCKLVKHDLLGDEAVTFSAKDLGRAEVYTRQGSRREAASHRVRVTTPQGELWLSDYSDDELTKHQALADRVNAFREGRAERLDERTTAPWGMGPLAVLFGAATLGLLHLGTRRWLSTFDRATRTVTLARTSLFGKKREEFAFDTLRAVELDVRAGKATHYLLRLRLVSEETRPLSEATSDQALAEGLVGKLNTIVGREAA